MAESKRIMISLPNTLLQEVDNIVAMEKGNRSQFIREAMRLYIRERRKIQIRENMKKGYREMGAMNLALSEVGLDLDISALKSYEAKLAECE
ncbi:ribbon-helix-helix protein, CopG family [Crassaminicella thermophila]|uniref:Ribbon-helix-helix protein, CopG family n=1 Tax=Crassaminicella thermophila TaxID=2599308 RepID=A0A5C0SB99_CRATE|nr:ribbon-helix-helix protein, CopG family [Crassaminicella thermophila]QEK11441.1 ribbon-helix-helix protein, CopG family [Crassaminicella thermophila]